MPRWIPLGRIVQGLKAGLPKSLRPPPRLHVAPRQAAKLHIITPRPANYVAQVLADLFGPLFFAQRRPLRASGIKPQRLRFVGPALRSSGRLSPRVTHLGTSLSRPLNGIGSARAFSTGAPVFANVIQNAPLGIRALVGSGLYSWEDLCERLARADVIRGVAHRRPKVPASRRSLSSSLPSLTSSVMPTTLSLSSDAESQLSDFFARAVDSPSVRLVFRKPMSLIQQESSYPEGGPRLLVSSAAANQIRDAFAAYEDRWTALLADIRRVFSKQDYQILSLSDSRHIDFYGRVTLCDVRQAVGLWTADASLEVFDLDSTSSSPTDEAFSSLRASCLRDRDDAIYHATASTLIMPDIACSCIDKSRHEDWQMIESRSNDHSPSLPRPPHCRGQ